MTKLRYMRARNLASSALTVLATGTGNIRQRMLSIDREFVMLPEDQLPNESRIREDHRELRKRLTRLPAHRGEGAIAATIGRARLSSLEQDASLVLSICLQLAVIMTI